MKKTPEKELSNRYKSTRRFLVGGLSYRIRFLVFGKYSVDFLRKFYEIETFYEEIIKASVV